MTQAIPAFVNPAAGSAPEAIERLRADDRFAIHEVDGEGLPAAVRAAVEARTRRILVSGGDGTIASAANALLGSQCELAVLPGGTLNHFARDLGLPRDDLEQCIEIAATGVARPTVPGFTVHLRRASCTAAVDGELIRLSPPLEYRFVADALRMVVPANGHPSMPRP